LTRGMLAVNGTQVRPLNVNIGQSNQQNRYEFSNQLQVVSLSHSPFFQPGDSGSAVLIVNDDQSLECIGMAIGCSSDGSAIVTPISAILDALGPGVTLKRFT